LRSIRRRVSSLAVTIRARDAIRLLRAWTLEIELATRCVKSVSRVSVSPGRMSSASTTITPQSAPSTLIGAPTTDPKPSSRAPGASGAGNATQSSTRAVRPVCATLPATYSPLFENV